MSLSDEFFYSSDLIELKAKIFYDEDKTDILHQYITFTKILMEQEEIYGRKKTAVEETIKICMNRDILSKYLGEREMEVISMMSLLYNEDVIRRNYMKEVIGEAEERGRAKEIISLSKDFGLSDTEILSRLQQKLEISKEEAKKYLEMFGE